MKTSDRTTSKPGSFKYKTKFSTEWSTTCFCIQPVDADVYAVCTVCSWKVNCSHQSMQIQKSVKYMLSHCNHKKQFVVLTPHLIRRLVKLHNTETADFQIF